MFNLALFLHFRSKIRDLAEKKYGKVPTGDSKPNSWTLLDFGKSYFLSQCIPFESCVVILLAFWLLCPLAIKSNSVISIS